MNIEQLLVDYHIPYQKSGHKHCRKGWANMACPFCAGTSGLHLGVELATGRWNCWRCGAKSPAYVISTLLGISRAQARKVLEKYSTLPSTDSVIEEKKEEGTLPFSFPFGTERISEQHKKYLVKRGFNPVQLVKEWHLLGTGNVALLDGIDFKFRVVAPIFWNGEVVSFQTRDITGKSELRYISCPRAREIVHHKYIVYGRQEKWKDIGIVVEGIADVWRFGYSAMATFGTSFKLEQVLAIASHKFKKIFVVFDSEIPAQRQASLLVARLQMLGISADKIQVPAPYNDPASMPQDIANSFLNSLGVER